MSYFQDDDGTEIDELKEKIESLQSQILNNSTSSILENVDSGQNSLPNTNPSSRTSINDAKTTDLGTFSGSKVIDFQIYDDRNLTGNVDGDTQITFVNIPFLLLLSLRLYIRSTDPIITIAGQIISGAGSSPLITTAVGDFLDISLASDDQSTIQILSVKKNDESGGNVAPNPPTIVFATPESTTSIDLFWEPPTLGSLPILYDVAWSLTSAGTISNGPDTPSSGSPNTNLTTVRHIVTGLTVDTTYFFWIRATNPEGNSDYAGPIQAKTLGAPTFVLSAIGRKLRFNVTFEPNISLVEIDYALDAAFTQKKVTKSFSRPLVGDWSISSSHDFDTPNDSDLIANTQFFGRVRVKKVQELSPYAATQNVTTGTLATPSQPPLSVTSPATDQIRIKVTYPDSPTRDEIAVLSWRLQSSVGEYFDTIYDVGTTVIANSYSRNQPPSDDLNSLENKVEVIREGAWNPGDSITVRCVLINAAGTSIASTDNVLVDP